MRHFEKGKIMKWPLIALPFCLSACLESPLLNHIGAPQNHGFTGDSSECPLSFEKEGLCAELTWVSYPEGEELGVLNLNFWAKVGGAKSGPYLAPRGTPFVYLWMPHGHGTSPTEISGSDGQYKVTEVFFNMSGDWDFHVQLKSGGRVLDESTMRYVAP
jgi:hypothetical protein